MRILLACHQFFPRFYTGTETLTLEVASELRTRGHEIAILTTEPILPGDPLPGNPEVREEVYEGFQVWKLVAPVPTDVIERLDRESFESPLIGFFARVLDEWNPEVAYIFHLMRLTSSLTDQLLARRIPTYFIPTDFWMICPTYQLVRYDTSLCSTCGPHKCYQCLLDLYITKNGKGYDLSSILKIAQRYPGLASLLHKRTRVILKVIAKRHERHIKLISSLQGVFFPNQFMQRTFHTNNLRNDNEYIIPFPIPERSKAVFNLEAPQRDGPLKVAFIGTLRQTKGPQILLNACARMSRRNDIEVNIWGAASDKSFESALRNAAEGIPWVYFRGTFPQEKLADVLKDAHVVVIPSLWFENTPLVALSTLASRRVLIVSDVGGLSSLVDDGVSGLVFPPGDSGALASLLTRLAERRELVEEISRRVIVPYTVNKYVGVFWEVHKKGHAKTTQLGVSA